MTPWIAGAAAGAFYVAGIWLLVLTALGPSRLFWATLCFLASALSAAGLWLYIFRYASLAVIGFLINRKVKEAGHG